MPFEPLRTDEKLERPAKSEPDLDTQMLFGCSGFVSVALISYFLSVWPFIAFAEVGTNSALIRTSLLGLVPAAGAGLAGCLRAGLAGACGFVAGSLTTAIFLYLRLQQLVIGGMAGQIETPEWPPETVYLLPFGYVLGAMLVAVAFTKREKAAPE